MVLDVLDNFGKYAALNPYFSLVDAFMRTHQLEELALGTYNIKGEDVVLKIEQAMGKSNRGRFGEPSPNDRHPNTTSTRRNIRIGSHCFIAHS